MSRSFSNRGLPKSFEGIKEALGLKVSLTKEKVEYFYSEGYAFKEYTDKNGVVYEEFEAGCPWASGPELFLGLRQKDNKKEICSWTQSQMGFSEKVKLPSGYNPQKILGEFIKEETGPNAFGYCPLYVSLTDTKITITQRRSNNHYENDVRVFDLIKIEDGPIIRDWLTQKRFSVVEL